MLAFWCEFLVEIEMAVKSLPLVTILIHGLAFFLGYKFSLSTPLDSIDAFSSLRWWFWMYLQGFKPGTAGKTYETFGMKMLRSSAEFDHSSLDWQLALMACCGCSPASCWGPVASRNWYSRRMARQWAGGRFGIW
jgi:hypothetical protein